MDKIRLSDLRAQYPMYADIEDDQFLVGLRKKLYADIPREKFYSRIEFDTAPDPTASMSGADLALAGIGRGMTDVGRGIGQMVGLVDRADVAAARKRDAPLMATGAGAAGNIAGNVAAMLPTAFIPGAATLKGAAAIGAGSGLMAPSVDTGETIQNTLQGAALGPAAILAGRALGAGARGVQSLLDPFTKAGQEKVAARTLQQFAGGDKAAVARALQSAKPIVPGSMPTMAQAADDAGLAQLERTLRNNPETGPLIAARLAEQRAARLGEVSNMAGTGAARDAAVAAREAATGSLYGQATKAAYFVDDKLQNLLDRPVLQSAMQRAQKLASNQGRGGVQITSETAAPFSGVGGVKATGRKAITGQGLQDLKMALDDMLSDPMAGIGKNEAATVKATRAQLLDWMEGANPAFKQARETFSAMSRPVNTMDVASDLLNRMESPLSRAGGASQREMRDAYARALEQSTDSVKRQIGIDLPLDRVMAKGDIQRLQNVAQDMARSARAEDLGRAVGSNTAQNLAAQNLMRRVLGPTGLPDTWAESNLLQGILSPYTGLSKLAGAENAVLNRLTQAALDPKDAAKLLLLMQQQSRAGLLGQEAMRYLPAASLGLLGQSP